MGRYGEDMGQIWGGVHLVRAEVARGHLPSQPPLRRVAEHHPKLVGGAQHGIEAARPHALWAEARPAAAGVYVLEPAPPRLARVGA